MRAARKSTAPAEVSNVAPGDTAALVKEALKRDMAIRDVAIEKARAGELKHRDYDRPVSPEEVEGALNDMRRLTESGIA